MLGIGKTIRSMSVSLLAMRQLWDSLPTELRAIQNAIREHQEGVNATFGQLLEEFAARLTELEGKVDMLPQKWEEIEHKARRTEERTRASVRRIKDRFEASGVYDDELEGLSIDVGLSDGTRSGEEAMPAMHEGMGDPRNGGGPPPGEDWQQATLRHKYGR